MTSVLIRRVIRRLAPSHQDIHQGHPYVLSANGHEYRVDYEPGESSTGLFGGNSNWRGPIWRLGLRSTAHKLRA